jgi:hypothetical protein
VYTEVIKVRIRFISGITILLIVGLLGGLFGYEYFAEQDFGKNSEPKVNRPEGLVSIVIQIDKRLLTVYEDGHIYKNYRIAVGKSKTPTPLGEWNVVWKDYYWGSGFGTRWMGLNVSWGIYGIHGTNNPWSIGRFASHGCIRMRNKDVEELFEWTPIGTPVRIEGRRLKVQRILRYKDTGSDVAVMQMKLKENGCLEGRADGIFGIATVEAVRLFQQEHAMEVTGIVDKAMLNYWGI